MSDSHHLPNTGVDYFAYGLHQVNSLELYQHILDDIMTKGTNVSYENWRKETTAEVEKWLDDIDTTEGEDDITSGIIEALKAAHAISEPYSIREHAAIGEIRDLHGPDGWCIEEIMDTVFDLIEYQGEEDTYVYTDEEADVDLMASTLGGAYLTWVTRSPFVTPCTGCSPCIPGGGDLDAPSAYFLPSESRPGRYDPQNGKWAFCLPPKWFEEADEPCPYQVVHRRGEGVLTLGDEVDYETYAEESTFPTDEVLLGEMRRRAEELGFLIKSVREDLVEQLPSDDHDPIAALKSLRQFYHERELGGRYFIADTLLSDTL